MSTLRTSVLTPRRAQPVKVEAPQDVLYKAERAAMLLEDDILREAFDALEVENMETAIDAESDDVRRRALDMVRAVREVRFRIHAHVKKAEQSAREKVVLP